jgi:hypothetical protein
MSRNYTPVPLVACMAVAGRLYFYVYNLPDVPLDVRKMKQQKQNLETGVKSSTSWAEHVARNENK